MKDLSVVIPIYNEESNIEELISEINQILNPLHLDYEVIAFMTAASS